MEDMTQMVVDSGSFRDPSGSVFSLSGKILRSIFEPGIKDFESARNAGVYDKLIENGILIPHKEVDLNERMPEGTVYCLEHPRVAMVSYPWEWPFSLLKDAALIQLDAMEMLLPHGFWLRDASAFNVQYDGNGLRLITITGVDPSPCVFMLYSTDSDSEMVCTFSKLCVG